jgi:pyruvate kinase
MSENSTRKYHNSVFAKTKIIATIGPSSSSEKVLKQLADAGMSCARINTAHGDFVQYKKLIDAVRQAGQIPIMIDIKGPEIRIRMEKEISITAGEEKEFYFKDGMSPHFSYDFSKTLQLGDTVYFDNGQIEAEVKHVTLSDKPSVRLFFNEACVIKTNKGVNVPGKEMDIPALSEKDHESIEFAIKEKCTFVAVSFARYKEDLIEVKRLLGNSGICTIAKIENHEGLKNIDEIIEYSDGIMIARGDLGVEIPVERIPYLQKEIVKKCNNAGKISIVATQMLETMIENKNPTRAEVSDVANAVLDGADAVMLSGETASGKHPVETVSVMHNIVLEVEDKIKHNVEEKNNKDVSKKISSVAYHLAQSSGATRIVCITRSGFSARLVSRYRPTAPILAVTDSAEAFLHMRLVWGIVPILLPELPLRLIMPTVSEELIKRKFLTPEDFVVFVGGIRTLEKNVSNLVEIHNIKNLLEYKDALLEQ